MALEGSALHACTGNTLLAKLTTAASVGGLSKIAVGDCADAIHTPHLPMILLRFAMRALAPAPKRAAVPVSSPPRTKANSMGRQTW